jgi:hypothetical protein
MSMRRLCTQCRGLERSGKAEGAFFFFFPPLLFKRRHATGRALLAFACRWIGKHSAHDLKQDGAGDSFFFFFFFSPLVQRPGTCPGPFARPDMAEWPSGVVAGRRWSAAVVWQAVPGKRSDRDVPI